MMAGKTEVGLVLLGVLLHSAYMLSIFDIYFKTPIIHGMEPVAPRIHAPAKRLVLFLADGLRADKFFELENKKPRAPFLHNVIHKEGRWGVSHARPPTESRPGHVAIIAGFYEDPSAVTKGWKANPVEFDSVFNRSRYTISFGGPDIVPIFCGALPNTLWETYSHEFEDFATDASFLDEWTFDKFHDLLNRARTDTELKEKLDGDGSVVFLHMLGCDTNGHAHRPYSQIYLNNVRILDKGVEKTVQLMEEIFPDRRTAYVFTADHGVSDKGSHGDGDPANTRTPLVVWGAGVRGPSPAKTRHGEENGEHIDGAATPANWGPKDVERLDVNQGDLAPLMSSLLGLPCPMNSVGVVPTDYLALEKAELAEVVFANAKQILNQVVRKSDLKQASSLFFKPFPPLQDYRVLLEQIEADTAQGLFDSAIERGRNLIQLALDGLHYFQTYDWRFLMTVVVTGYLGWMLYILLHVLKTYSPISFQQGEVNERISGLRKIHMRMAGGAFMAVCSAILLIEAAPLLYHVYLGLAVFFWTEVSGDWISVRRVISVLLSTKLSWYTKLFALVTTSFLVLELLVQSFFQREVYTAIFIVAGVIGAVAVSANTPGVSIVPAFVWASCWFLSGFTLMPVQIADNTYLVVGSGLAVGSLAYLARWIDCSQPKMTFWRPLVCGYRRKLDQSWILFILQVLLVIASSVMVWITTSHRETTKKTLPVYYQLINWSVSGISILLPLKSPRTVLTRLTSIYLGFAPPFLLLSIGYESLFYTALAVVLLAWILVESAVLFGPSGENVAPLQNVEEKYSKTRKQTLKLLDVRVALCFLILVNAAFFGTGNVASIASFEISSVYRFITIFNPFIMGALLLCKVFIPFILVTSAFSAVTRLLALPRFGCYLLVLLLSDVMTIHFFFLVRNTGSWLDIGQTISHFGIMSAQVVFVLILFALTSFYTRDLECSYDQTSYEKSE